MDVLAICAEDLYAESRERETCTAAADDEWMVVVKTATANP
jgi:hypothetical protein